MEIRGLRYFIRAAELLHFTNAAESLHISQPTLSAQIQQLEEELGTPLFTRGARQMRLTQAGELLLDRARRAIRELETARQELTALTGLARGTLKIGSMLNLNQNLLPQWILRFNEKYPNIEVVVISGNSRRICDGIIHGELDLGFTFTSEEGPEIESEHLYDDAVGLVVADSHPLSANENFSWNNIEQLRLALPGIGIGTRPVIDRNFANSGFRPSIALEIDDIHGLLLYTKLAGLATLLTTTAMAGRTGFKILAIDGAPFRVSFGAVWRRGDPLCASALAFLDLVREASSSLPN